MTIRLAPFITAFSVGFDTLRVNPLRTVLSTLGVIIGVGALVAVLSLGDGMEQFARSQLERNTDIQTVTVSSRTYEYRDGYFTPVRDYPVFTTRDARELANDVPYASHVSMTLHSQSDVLWGRTGLERQTNITASTAGSDEFMHLEFAEGRFFTAAEAARNAPVIILSYKLAGELAGGRRPESMVGEFVRVNGLPREVIGVLAPVTDERGYEAHIPFASSGFGSALVNSRTTPTIFLRARSVEDVEPMRHAIEDWLARRYGRWEHRVDVQLQQGRLEQITRSILVMKLFLGALAGISLLVGGIGIMNIMLASVTERTREIGVRKAMGARGSDIHLQFLTESVVVSGLGSALGVLLGLGLSAIAILIIRNISKADGLSVTISLSTALVAATSAIAIGLVFGTYPARRAAGLSPIDAIRHE